MKQSIAKRKGSRGQGGRKTPQSAKPQSSLVNKEYRFVRWAQYSNLGSSTVSFTNTGYSFRLSDLPTSSEFTSLFDQYRIDQIELMFIPGTTQALPTAQLNGAFYCVVDYDDAQALSTAIDYLQYSTFREDLLQVGTGIKRVTFKPRIAMAAYSGGVFTSYANTGNQWLDVGSPGVEHFGVKVGVSATTSAVTWQVLAKFIVTFRHPR